MSFKRSNSLSEVTVLLSWSAIGSAMANGKTVCVLGKGRDETVIGILVDDDQLKAAVGLRLEVEKEIRKFFRATNSCQQQRDRNARVGTVRALGAVVH